ncbi:MAG: hypothetical protein LBT30_05170 [Clostridiales bacterium]|nr:hypothetical protein [Clostridiales bacterium]
MTKSKMTSLIFIGLLFIWFLFDMTGLSFGNVSLVASCFIDEPIDFIFFLIFAVAIFLFIWREKIGKWVIFAFLLCWLCIQGAIYFRNDYSGYYLYFAEANTHRIFTENAYFLIKDTYHLILDILILSAFISVAVFLILTRKHKKNT